MRAPHYLAFALIALASFLAGGQWAAGIAASEKPDAPATEQEAASTAARSSRLSLHVASPSEEPPAMEPTSDRVEVASEASGSQPTPPTDLDGIFAELAKLKSEGGIKQQAHHELLKVLVEGLLDQGHPVQAADAFASYGTGFILERHLLGNIANTLEIYDFKQEALVAYLGLATLNPWNAHNYGQAIAIDPGQALAAIREVDLSDDIPLRDLLKSLEARALIRLGQNDEALTILEFLLEINPENREALDTLGEIAPERALERAKSLAEEDPLKWAENYAWLLSERGDVEGTVAVLVELIEAGGDKDDLLSSIIYTYPLSAFDHMNGALAPEPGNAETTWLWECLGGELEEAGFAQEASESWLKALTTAPHDEFPCFDRLLEDSPYRLVDAMKTKTEGSNNAYCLKQMAHAYWTAGLPAKAIVALKSAAANATYPGSYLKQVKLAEAGTNPFE